MKKIIALGLAFAPTFVFAQGLSGGVGTADSAVNWLISAFSIASGLILTAAVIFFLWGVFQYVRAAGDEGAQEVGRAHIINGIIGIAVMVSVWGLVNFFTRSANLQGGVQQAPTLPTIQG
jgi:hypothetical protein